MDEVFQCFFPEMRHPSDSYSLACLSCFIHHVVQNVNVLLLLDVRIVVIL